MANNKIPEQKQLWKKPITIWRLHLPCWDEIELNIEFVMWSYFKLEILEENLNRKYVFYNSFHRSYHEDFNEVPVLIQKTGEGKCWGYYTPLSICPISWHFVSCEKDVIWRTPYLKNYLWCEPVWKIHSSSESTQSWRKRRLYFFKNIFTLPEMALEYSDYMMPVTHLLWDVTSQRVKTAREHIGQWYGPTVSIVSLWEQWPVLNSWRNTKSSCKMGEEILELG